MKALRILILFVVFLSGCSKKYLVSKEEELIDHKVFSSWKELEGRVVGQNDDDVSLGLKVKDFAIIRDELKLKEVYVDSSGKGGDVVKSLLGLSVICLGFQGGCAYAKSGDYYIFPDDDKLMGGCLISLASCFLGARIMSDEMFKDSEYVKIIPDFIRIDTLCLDSIPLINDKVKIATGDLDFEKKYYTDEKGNIVLKFEEIIPEPMKADSVLDFIIRYYELVDTVRVRRL